MAEESLTTIHRKHHDEIPYERQVFCNRTLNMRSIRAIGYDMDYTLVHYKVEEWERRAYNFLKEKFLEDGWPVQNLNFETDRICRGLIIDTEKGNIVKANRFGFIKQAMHGTKLLGFEEQRAAYARTIVDLNEKRWVFLNTLFSLSEGCMYAQLVDLLDQKQISEVLGYTDLYERVRRILDNAHMEGRLKAEIIAHPERFIILDEELALTLLDQMHAGKRLVLITNSEWTYTSQMMSYAFDRFLPKGMTWRSLFELIIVGARKPSFFMTKSPFFEVVTEEGLLKPVTGNLAKGAAYLGGSAAEVEKFLGISGDELLYVGDHMFGDVQVTKNVLRWRTALIIRELEEEIRAAIEFRPTELILSQLMLQKESLEAEACQVKLQLQRVRDNYLVQTPDKDAQGNPIDHAVIQKTLDDLYHKQKALDVQIGPLVKKSWGLNNPFWGLLMRTGNDKSHLAYQMERYADIYASRVSNMLYATPFVYLRSPRGSLPHDPSLPSEQANEGVQ